MPLLSLRTSLRITSGALTLLLAACSGGGGGSTPPPTPIPAATLELFAGAASGYGNADGIGTAAAFSFPIGLAADLAGNIYVADSGNATIRKIDPTRRVTTIAGSSNQRGYVDGPASAARFGFPTAIAVDRAGNVYAADPSNYNVRKITPAGSVTTLAGGSPYGSEDGVGTAARFAVPAALAADGAGNVYVADAPNFTLRKIAPDGRVLTLAGAPGQSGSVDGSGPQARFVKPSGLAVDAAGNIYVVDGDTIRKVTPAGDVSTFAGRAGAVGNANGPAAEATFTSPSAIAIDALGNLYVVETVYVYGRQVRKITPEGIVTTLSSVRASGGLAVSPGGTVFLSDSFNNGIHELTPAGEIVIAGSDSNLGAYDGVGAQARFAYAGTIAIDTGKNIYVADSSTIRKVTPPAQVTTVGAFSADSLATDAAGALYMGSASCPVPPRGTPPACVGTLRKLSGAGIVTVITPATNSDATGMAIERPYGLAIDAAGNLYVADRGQAVIRRITPAGDISTLAGLAHSNGSVDGLGRSARFISPGALAIGPSGDLFVADGNAIRRVTASGDVTTLAGSTAAGSVDGVGSAARFSSISGIAIDEQGNLYAVDSSNYTVRKITSAGVVTTIVGIAGVKGFMPGPLPGALNAPVGVAVSGSDLYITNSEVLAVVRNRP